MKNIEIITSQNVVLQYELAGLRDRAIAFLIDFVCLTIFLWISAIVLLGMFVFSETGGVVVYILVICIFVFYSLAFETLNKGQSLGKMALRLQVIRLKGGRATFSDYVARWVFRLIDIYLSFGSIASILIVSSSKAQRIGDVVANTAVVKMVPKTDLDLKSLLALHQQDAYNPQYPQARKLQEEDALLIKSTLDRHRKFDNPAHREAIDLLSKRVRELLDIEYTGNDQRLFLRTVLQDYVILTR